MKNGGAHTLLGRLACVHEDAAEALRFEAAYADELRGRGWSVWQN